MSFIYNLLHCTVDAVDTTPQTPSSSPIPICPEAKDKFNCSADWLSQILGKSIESFNIKPVGGGMTTQAYRINYMTEEKEESVFLKYLVLEGDRKFLQRLMNFFSELSLDKLSKKEAYFYTNLSSIYNEHGIQTPRPLYVALEGKFIPIMDLIGFTSDFRGVICMEDLGKCECFGVTTTLPDQYATFITQKLAQFHSLNWNQTINPESASEYRPEAYMEFFGLRPQNFLTKKLNLKQVQQQIQLWKEDYSFVDEPIIKDALIAFHQHPDLLSQYNTNNNLSSGPLFQHQTFLHGDFHSGNILFKTEPSQEDKETKEIKEAVLIDWQCFGTGHASTEFSYFIGNVAFDPERDLKLMKIYYEELTKKVNPLEYPWEVFQREVEIRSVQFAVTGFNIFFKYSPEDFKKFRSVFEKRGVDMDEFINGYRSKFLRFAHVMEKWNQENILERIDAF